MLGRSGPSTTFPASSLSGDLSPLHWQMRLLRAAEEAVYGFPNTAITRGQITMGSGSSSAGRQAETTAFAKLNLRLIGI